MIKPKITVRKAERADADALAALFAATWRNAYRGIIPHLSLETLIRARGPAWWQRTSGRGGGLLVIEFEGVVAGYTTFGRARWALPYEGEIYELYMEPTYQGVGLGEHLFEGARHMLDMRRLKGLVVWALEDNEGACEFYRRRGGRAVARGFERFGGKRLSKIAFAWG